MGQVSQVLGFLGTVTVAIGYLPQIRHLARERCSAGVSVVAWQIWLLASLLIFSHALQMVDLVFIVLQGVHIVAIVSIIFLARRYRGLTCTFHRLLADQAVGSVLKAVEAKVELINASR
jgi:lipid-A-disaccharide synthase-like uncharacterized protein